MRKVKLTVWQQHYTAQGYTPSHLFGCVVLAQRWPLGPWLVEDSELGFCYEPGDRWDWCSVNVGQYDINRHGYRFHVEATPCPDTAP